MNLKSTNQYLTLILVLFFTIGYAQSEKNDTIIHKKEIALKTCKNGIEHARIDFENGKYNTFSNSLRWLSKEDWGFQNFYREYMKSEYGIHIKVSSCIVTNESICYSNTMQKMILKKFGDDIFEKSRVKAKQNCQSATKS